MAITKEEKNGLNYYTWLPLELIRKDDKNDVALLQIEDFDKTLLEPLELDDSEKVEAGDEAYFIGFPYAAQLINDKFGITLIVNKTIISNIKRDGINPNHPRNWLIVDAISNPGNSGAPVFVHYGNLGLVLFGILVAAYPTEEEIRTAPGGVERTYALGISKVVPIQKVVEILNQEDLRKQREQAGAPEDTSIPLSADQPPTELTRQGFVEALKKVSRPDGKEVIEKQDRASSET